MRVHILNVLALAASFVAVIASPDNALNIVCTLRGKKYDVSASTVAQVKTALQEQAGLEAEKQGIIFKGRKLEEGEVLEEAGVSDGDIINIVPQKASSSKPKQVNLSDGFGEDDMDDEVPKSGSSDSLFSQSAGLEDAMKGMDLDGMMEAMGGKEGIQSMMKQFGLDGPVTQEKVEQAMSQIKTMFQNPAMKQFFEDPEILEQSRQQILSNPMLMNAYEAMGMGDLIRNPETFRNQMLSFKKLMENPEAFAALGSSMGAAADRFEEGEL